MQNTEQKNYLWRLDWIWISWTENLIKPAIWENFTIDGLKPRCKRRRDERGATRYLPHPVKKKKKIQTTEMPPAKSWSSLNTIIMECRPTQVTPPYRDEWALHMSQMGPQAKLRRGEVHDIRTPLGQTKTDLYLEGLLCVTLKITFSEKHCRIDMQCPYWTGVLIARVSILQVLL
jgi:hypothetical protein